LENESDARTLINHLKPNERELLLNILRGNAEAEASKNQAPDEGQISYAEAKQLFLFNTLPFIGNLFKVIISMIDIYG
jgi:hypothetical protein